MAASLRSTRSTALPSAAGDRSDRIDQRAFLARIQHRLQAGLPSRGLTPNADRHHGKSVVAMHLDRTLTFFQAAERRLIEIVFRGGNMEKPSLLNLHLSNKLTLPSCIPLLTNMLRLSGRLGGVIAVCALLTSLW
jgi:hypothetical protein